MALSTTFKQCAMKPMRNETTKFGKITQNNGHFAVHGHSSLPILVPIESSYTTSLANPRGGMPPRHVGKRPECTKSRHFHTQNRKKILGRGNARPLGASILVIGDREDSNFDEKVEFASHSLRRGSHGTISLKFSVNVIANVSTR